MFKRKFSPYYLFVLLIPLVYWFLPSEESSNKPLQNIPEYLWFSARSTGAADISLYSSGQQLCTWHLDSGGFKLLDYTGPLNKGEALQIHINSTRQADTVSFLGLNLFSGNKAYALHSLMHTAGWPENAGISESSGFTKVFDFMADSPAILTVRPPLQWESADPSSSFLLLMEFVFVLLLVVLHLLNPQPRYVLFSTLVALLVLFLAKTFYTPSGGHFRLESRTNIPVGEMFYNHHPQFTHLKSRQYLFPGNAYGMQVPSAGDRFIRFDADGTVSLTDLSISARYGLFAKTFNPAGTTAAHLVLNDLEVSGNDLIRTGPDPFISATSLYFTAAFERLHLFDTHSSFLLALLCFVLLILLQRFIAPYLKLQFKPAFLVLLVLPVAYGLLRSYNADLHLSKVKQKDYFYCSVKAPRPVIISLYAGNDSLTSLAINKPGFCYIDALDTIPDTIGISLRINNLAAGDTVSFTGFHLFRNKRLSSLYDAVYPWCGTEHATASTAGGLFSVVAQETGMPVNVNLAPAQYWEQLPETKSPLYAALAAMLLILVLLPAINPPPSYTITITAVTLILLGIFRFLGSDIQEQVVMTTATPQRSVETYYAKTPLFNSSDKFPVKNNETIYRTHIELGKHIFFRCDPDYESTYLKDFKVTLSTGLLRKSWPMGALPPSQLVINDLDFDRGHFRITGNDPFFAFTGTRFTSDVLSILEHRRNAFLFAALFILLVLLLLHRYASPLHPRLLIPVVLFLSIAGHTFLFLPFNSGRERLKAEKRNAGRIPDYKTLNLKDYARHWGTYLSDRLNGRNSVILLNNYLYYAAFGGLVNNPDIYYGKEGWMFYVGALGRELFENRKPFTNDEMQKTTDLFVERRNWLRNQGIRFYIFFPRVAQFIYEDMVGPRMVRHNPVSKLDQLMHYMRTHSDLDIIDVATPITGARDTIKTDLYHRNDSHWNYQGAWFAYDTIISYVHRDFPEIEKAIPYNAIRWVYSEDYLGDLADYAALSGYVLRKQFIPRHPALFPIEPDFMNGEDNFERISLNPAKADNPSMLMFRDSYAKYLVPFMGHHFSKTSYIWTYTFNKEIILKHKPDIVLWQMSERFIYTFPIKNQPFYSCDKLTSHFPNTRFMINHKPHVSFRDIWISTNSESKNKSL